MHRLFYFELPSAPIKNRLAVFSSSCGMLLRRAAVQPLETPALSRTATISSGDRTVARTGPGGHVGRVFVAMGRTVHCPCFLHNMWTPKTFCWYFVGVWNRQVSLFFCCISSSILTATLRLPKIHTGGLYRSTCSDPHRRLLTPHMSYIRHHQGE